MTENNLIRRYSEDNFNDESYRRRRNSEARSQPPTRGYNDGRKERRDSDEENRLAPGLNSTFLPHSNQFASSSVWFTASFVFQLSLRHMPTVLVELLSAMCVLHAQLHYRLAVDDHVDTAGGSDICDGCGRCKHCGRADAEHPNRYGKGLQMQFVWLLITLLRTELSYCPTVSINTDRVIIMICCTLEAADMTVTCPISIKA